MATQTGSIDLTASNSVKLMAEAGFESVEENYYTKSQLDVTVQGINTEVSKKVNGTEIISTINQSSESVSINANKINLQGAVTISDLASDAQNATLNSNISVGGRNLLAYSGTGKNWSYSTFTDGVYTSSTTTTSESFVVGKTTVPLELGSTYTFSAWMKTNGQVSSVEMFLYDAAGKTVRSKNFGALTTDWEHCTWTVTMPDTWASGTNETATWNARFDNNGSKASGTEAILYVRQPKLEKGTTATDWTPAPEDVDSAISNAAKTATSYVTEITGQNGIMVHPSTDQTTGVQVTDSVNIMRDGVSVAEYGETARVGAESSAHSVWESGEFVFNDGSNDTMKLSALESITETHVIPSSNVSYYAYIELEYPPASLISVEVDNTEYTYTPTMTPYGLKLWKHGGDGDGFDGETVTVTYKPSPAMYIYDGSGDDDSNIAARINANEVSLAKGVFSVSTEYDLSSGSIVGGDVRIGDSEASRSEMMLRSSSDSSYLTFQTKGGNRTAAFVLNSGSTNYPDRVLDLIYLDRINYADPYGGSDRQLGAPTRLTASGNYTAGTADTKGPYVTLTAGIWLIAGSWNFANSSSNSKRLTIGLYRSTTGQAYTYRIHTTASSSSAHRLEVVDTIVVSATSERVTLYGASSPASTSAATQYITAIRLA